jgi:hypothetical protein
MMSLPFTDATLNLSLLIDRNRIFNNGAPGPVRTVTLTYQGRTVDVNADVARCCEPVAPRSDGEHFDDPRAGQS